MIQHTPSQYGTDGYGIFDLSTAHHMVRVNQPGTLCPVLSTLQDTDQHAISRIFVSDGLETPKPNASDALLVQGALRSGAASSTCLVDEVDVAYENVAEQVEVRDAKPRRSKTQHDYQHQPYFPVSAYPPSVPKHFSSTEAVDGVRLSTVEKM
eukprot:1743070-Rhodomonas_salina.5